MIHKLWIGVFIGALMATAAVGQTVTETFETGIPASWTIQDNFPIPGSPAFSAVPWTTNDVEGLLNYTGGMGLAATASSQNHPGQYDISLITPTFLIHAGPDGDVVRYTVNYFRVDAFEAFDTNLSLNGGPWIPMRHQITSQGPGYSTAPPKIDIGIDMGFFGAMPGDLARVEFRYYSTFLLPMVRNEYVEIDDVQIPTPIPEPATIALTVSAVAFAAMIRVRRCGLVA